MKPNFYLMDAVTLAAIWYLFIPPPALAYFDLGVGTYLIQLIFGFGAAIWLSMMARLRRKKAAFFAKDEKAATATDKLEPNDKLAGNNPDSNGENESTGAITSSNASPLTSSSSEKTSPVEATVSSGSDDRTTI